MALVNAAVGVVKCSSTKKLYGVRVEERSGGTWTATWAFPISQTTAQREGYEESEFPPGLILDNSFPGCPYCRKRESLPIAKSPQRISVNVPRIMVGSKSSYDDLGKVLTSMSIAWSPMGSLTQCDMLFLNCLGTSPNASDLREFVQRGGCVFASCCQMSTLASAFPEICTFKNIGFKSGVEAVLIEDPELRGMVGNKIDISFHAAGKGNPTGSAFSPIMRSTGNLFERGTNICVKWKIGSGTIFFTMFHNSDNINEQEKALLQLLVLKGLGGESIEDIASNLGVDINSIIAKMHKM